MALMAESATARESVFERFGIAQDAPVPADIKERQLTQIKVRADIYNVAKHLNSAVADSREKSLALTKLEEALLWAGKAIFS